MLASKLLEVARLALSIGRRSPLVAGVATATLGFAPVAAADDSSTYIINFSHSPVINEGSQTGGNYQIWGLGYARLIVGSQGQNVIVGDGACPPGSTVTAYCSVAPVEGSRSAVIYGNGHVSNTIYAGYGPSVIFGGTGPNTITSSPTASLIVGGNAGDTINADQGATLVYAGTGTNTIYARSSEGDTVYCTGTHDTVYAYANDHIHNCAHVIYATEPAGDDTYADHHRHYHPPSLRHDRLARQLYARFKLAERHAHR